MLPRVPSQNKEPVYTAIGAPDLPYMLNELSPVSQYYAVKASRKRRIKDEKEGIVYVFLNDAGDTLLFSARGKEAKRLYFDFGAAEKNPNILLKANCLGAEKKHADIASEMQDKDLPKKGNKIRTWDECFAKGMDGDYKWQVLTQDILVKAATENLIPSSEKRAEIRRLLTPQKIGAYKKQCENGSNTYPAEVLEAFGRLNNIKFNTWQMAADKKGIRRVVATRYIAGYQLGEKPFECDLLLSGDTAAPVFQELKFNVSETELKKLRNLPDGEEVLEFKPSAASAQRVSPPQKATNAASAAAGLFDLIPPPPPLPITEKNLHHSAVVDESLSAGNTSRFPVGRRKAMGAAEMDFLNTIANLPAERLKEVFDAENQAGAEASFIKALDAIPERQQRENLKAARKRLLSIVGKSDQDPDGALLKEMLKKYVNIRDAGGVNSELGAATIRVVCLMQAQLSRMYSKKAIADIMKRVWDDETWTSDRIDKDFAGIFQDIQRQGAEEKQAKAERRKSVQVSAAPPKAPPPPPPHRSSVAESGDDAILAAARRTDELDALERKQQEDSNKQSASPFQSVAGAFLAAEDEGSDKDDEPFVEAEDYGVIIEYSIDESGLPRITRFSDERNVDDLLRYIKQERHYDLLDISSQADPDEIKKAYRRLALFWHPDKNGSKHAEAIFKGVGSAYTTLSNPDEKNAYDARLRQQDLDRNSSAVASAAAQSAQAAQKAQSSKPAASRVTFQLSNQPALQSTAEVSSAVVVREEKLAASGTSPTHANKMLARRAAAQKADTATVTETSVVAKARDVLEPLTPQKSLLNQPPKPSSSGKKKNASDAVENDTASQVTSSSKAVSRKPGVPGHVVSKRPSVTSMAQGIAVASGASKLLARKAKNTAAAAQSDDMMSVMSDLTADSNFPEPKYQKGNTKKDNTVPSPVLNVSLSDSGSVHSAESGSTMSLRERLGKPPLALGLKPTSSTPTKLSAIDEDTTSVSAVSLNSSDSVNSVKSVSSTMSLRERLGKKPLVLGPKPPSKLPVIKENIEEKATDQAQEMNVGGNTAVLGAVETGMVDPVELDMGAIDKIMKGFDDLGANLSVQEERHADDTDTDAILAKIEGLKKSWSQISAAAAEYEKRINVSITTLRQQTSLNEEGKGVVDALSEQKTALKKLTVEPDERIQELEKFYSQMQEDAEFGLVDNEAAFVFLEFDVQWIQSAEKTLENARQNIDEIESRLVKLLAPRADDDAAVAQVLAELCKPSKSLEERYADLVQNFIASFGQIERAVAHYQSRVQQCTNKISDEQPFPEALLREEQDTQIMLSTRMNDLRQLHAIAAEILEKLEGERENLNAGEPIDTNQLSETIEWASGYFSKLNEELSAIESRLAELSKPKRSASVTATPDTRRKSEMAALMIKPVQEQPDNKLVVPGLVPEPVKLSDIYSIDESQADDPEVDYEDIYNSQSLEELADDDYPLEDSPMRNRRNPNSSASTTDLINDDSETDEYLSVRSEELESEIDEEELSSSQRRHSDSELGSQLRQNILRTAHQTRSLSFRGLSRNKILPVAADSLVMSPSVFEELRKLDLSGTALDWFLERIGKNIQDCARELGRSSVFSEKFIKKYGVQNNKRTEGEIIQLMRGVSEVLNTTCTDDVIKLATVLEENVSLLLGYLKRKEQIFVQAKDILSRADKQIEKSSASEYVDIKKILKEKSSQFEKLSASWINDYGFLVHDASTSGFIGLYPKNTGRVVQSNTDAETLVDDYETLSKKGTNKILPFMQKLSVQIRLAVHHKTTLLQVDSLGLKDTEELDRKEWKRGNSAEWSEETKKKMMQSKLAEKSDFSAGATTPIVESRLTPENKLLVERQYLLKDKTRKFTGAYTAVDGHIEGMLSKKIDEAEGVDEKKSQAELILETVRKGLNQFLEEHQQRWPSTGEKFKLWSTDARCREYLVGAALALGVSHEAISGYSFHDNQKPAYKGKMFYSSDAYLGVKVDLSKRESEIARNFIGALTGESPAKIQKTYKTPQEIPQIKTAMEAVLAAKAENKRIKLAMAKSESLDLNEHGKDIGEGIIRQPVKIRGPQLPGPAPAG